MPNMWIQTAKNNRNIKEKVMKFLLILLVPSMVFAQNDSLKVNQNENFSSGIMVGDTISSEPSSTLKFKNFIVPGVLISYGVLATETKLFRKINFDTRNEIKEDHPSFATKIDNFSQAAPAVAVFALQAFGVKGQSTVKKEAVVYAMSLGISTLVVVPAKNLTHQERPDGSNFKSFPSGHTAFAFASAEFLRREYWETSPWIGVAGYAVAAGTGILRMYNNKHWLGDVAAGAGVGILSTTMSYWLYDKLHLDKALNKNRSTMIAPTFSNNKIGFGLVSNF